MPNDPGFGPGSAGRDHLGWAMILVGLAGFAIGLAVSLFLA